MKLSPTIFAPRQRDCFILSPIQNIVYWIDFNNRKDPFTKKLDLSRHLGVGERIIKIVANSGEQAIFQTNKKFFLLANGDSFSQCSYWKNTENASFEETVLSREKTFYEIPIPNLKNMYVGINNIAYFNGESYFATGANDFGQLGRAHSGSKSEPVQLKMEGGNKDFLEKIVDVSVGRSFTLLLDRTCNCYGAGLNRHGQLGKIKSREKIDKYEYIHDDVDQMSAGQRHTLLLLNNGKVLATGNNFDGQACVKNGFKNVYELTEITFFTKKKIKQIKALLDTSIFFGNEMYVCGNCKHFGFNHTRIDIPVILQVNGKSVFDVSLGENYALLLDKDGKIYCNQSLDKQFSRICNDVFFVRKKFLGEKIFSLSEKKKYTDIKIFV